MADGATLGFDIDTRQLILGKEAADRLRLALMGLADATDKEGAAATKSLQAQRARAEALQREAEATAKAAAAAQRKERATQSLNNVMTRTGGIAETVSQAINGMQTTMSNSGAAMASPQGIVSGMNGLGMSLSRLTPMLGTLGIGVGAVVGGVTALAAATIGLQAATVGAQEKYILLEARLKNVYGSAFSAREVMGELIDLSQKNAIAVDSTAESFLRLARNNESIGLTKREMIELTDTVQMLGRISNATGQEMQGALLQFSQALAAGRLNGDELRSIIETMPELTKAIAVGLGVTQGQLRQMGAEGQLTADKITRALLEQMPRIRAEFETLPETTSQAFTRVANNWDLLLSNMGERLNSSEVLTAIINAGNSVLEAAANALEVEGPDLGRRDTIITQLLEKEKQLEGMQDRRLTGAAVRVKSRLEGEIDTLKAELDEINQAISEARAEEAIDATRAMSAAFVRGNVQMQNLDKQAAEIKQLRESIEGLEAARRAFRENEALTEMGFGDENLSTARAREQYETMGVLIDALAIKVRQAVPAIEKYRRETATMMSDRDAFGFGGAASLAEEARKLMDQNNAKAGADVPLLSMEEALAAVTERRSVSLLDQTRAMDEQIAAEERRISLIGKGTQATIEAEVAAETYNLQLRLFGTEIAPPAAAALAEYAEQLRRLKQAQNEAADAQKLFNMQLDIADQLAINAAVAAGASAGEIEALKRGQRANRTVIEQSGVGGSFNLSSVATGGATRPDSFTGMDPSFRSALERMFADIPKELGVGIMSGFRSVQRQAEIWASAVQKYGSEAEARKWAAPPGRSYHNKGQAADLTYGTQEGRQWVHENASRYGLHFPLGNEPWHIEPIGARGGGTQAPVAASAGTTAAGTSEMAAVQLQLETLRALEPGLRRIAELEQARIDRERLAAADGPVARRAVEKEQIARKASEGFDPEQQSQVYNAELQRLNAEDEEAQLRKIQNLREQNEQQEEMLRLASMAPRQRQIELEVLRMINDEMAAGRAVSAEREEQIRQEVTRSIQLERQISEAQTTADRITNVFDTAASSIQSGLETAVRQAMANGRIEADKILEGILQDITIALMQAFVTGPLISAVKNYFNLAHGGVMDNGSLVPFAMGGLFDKPTVFPMARGLGLMGEAGPEAVLPLKRGADGKLGVSADSGGGKPSQVNVIVNDMRTAQGSQPAEVSEGTGANGERIIEVTVRDEVRRQIAGGSFHQEMRQTYAVAPPVTRR